eukprot:11747510-Alexandrium_andersonii.AAC.1
MRLRAQPRRAPAEAKLREDEGLRKLLGGNVQQPAVHPRARLHRVAPGKRRACPRWRRIFQALRRTRTHRYAT